MVFGAFVKNVILSLRLKVFVSLTSDLRFSLAGVGVKFNHCSASDRK